MRRLQRAGKKCGWVMTEVVFREILLSVIAPQLVQQCLTIRKKSA